MLYILDVDNSGTENNRLKQGLNVFKAILSAYSDFQLQ